MQKVKPLLRGHFHQGMFFISLGACAVLISLSASSLETLATIIYSIAVLSMFGISTIYHRITWSPEKRQLLKRLDHAGIYIMIAGSFTPVCLLVMPEPDGKNLLLIIWLVALVGILQSIFFVNLPKMISALIYIGMSFVIIPYLSDLVPKLGTRNLSLLLAGGVVYIIGAVAYGLKRPAFKPHIFGYHEFFHIMVCVGAILHFLMIYNIVS